MLLYYFLSVWCKSEKKFWRNTSSAGCRGGCISLNQSNLLFFSQHHATGRADRRVWRCSATKAAPQRKLMSLFRRSRNTTRENGAYSSFSLGGDNTFGYLVALVSRWSVAQRRELCGNIRSTSDEMHHHQRWSDSLFFLGTSVWMMQFQFQS